ncbi:nucleotidyltransferase family protein [Candidatus Leptofilum sp.]|uniref:nucleotidyltransferase domain-containing protein n=1 Tax=Candidatus Leptofilum sp. TaxID=3241576 RepID=UPI003B58D449
MMLDLNQRPQLPAEQLMRVTNALARWLPDGLEAEVANWSQAEWEAALWVAYWQNGLPWLADQVQETGIQLPEGVNGRLQTINTASRERTQAMLDACTEILATFKQAGIEVMLLKGAVLAPLYYPDPLLRPLADLDLLIRPKDVAASREMMLNQLGFRYYSRSAEDEVYLRGERKSNIWAPDNVHPVEIHFTLREEYAGIGYELAEIMWRESEERPYWQNTPACIPNPAALLLHVCAHTSSDWLIQRGRLMHIDDIRKLCATMQPTDWQTFARLVQPSTARFIYPALAFVGKYTRLAIPADTLNWLRENCPPVLLDWLAHTELADASEANPVNRSGIGLEIAQRLSRSRLDMARFWLRSFFPRRYNLAKRYPKLVETPFWPLAYLLLNGDRAIQIAKKRRG